jgi:hypothetical protein
MKKSWAVKLLTGMSIILLGFGLNGMECQASLDNQTIGQEGPRGRLGRSDGTDVEGQEGPRGRQGRRDGADDEGQEGPRGRQGRRDGADDERQEGPRGRQGRRDGADDAREEGPRGLNGARVVLKTVDTDAAGNGASNPDIPEKALIVSLEDSKEDDYTPSFSPKGNLILSADEKRNDWDICFTGDLKLGLNEDDVLIIEETGKPLLVGKNTDINLAINSPKDNNPSLGMFFEFENNAGGHNLIGIKDLEKANKQSISLVNIYNDLFNRQEEDEVEQFLVNPEWIREKAYKSDLESEMQNLREKDLPQYADLINSIRFDEWDQETGMSGILSLNGDLTYIHYNDPEYTWEGFSALLAEREAEESKIKGEINLREESEFSAARSIDLERESIEPEAAADGGNENKGSSGGSSSGSTGKPDEGNPGTGGELVPPKEINPGTGEVVPPSGGGSTGGPDTK